MTHASADVETPDFTMPNSVVRAPVEKGSNPAKKPSKHTPESNITYELFVAGTEPTQVSDAYDKLDAPSVSGEYQEEGNQVAFTWSHPEKGLEYEVKVDLGGGKQKDIGKTSDTSFTINDVEPGETYGIQVVAVSDSQRSAPGSASVTVPSKEDDEEEEEIQDDEQDENQDGEENPDEGQPDNNDQKDNQNDDQQNNDNNQQPGNNDNDSGGNENPGNDNNDGENEGNQDNPASPPDGNSDGRRENN